MNKVEVKRAIDLLLEHSDKIAWLDFGDKGNPCYNPYDFETEKERIKEAYSFAAVKIQIPKGSELHRKFGESIAQNIGCKYVTYDWLIKALSRIIPCFIDN